MYERKITYPYIRLSERNCILFYEEQTIDSHGKARVVERSLMNCSLFWVIERWREG